MIFIFAFLVVLQPLEFGNEAFKINRNLTALTYALIAGMVILAHRIVLKKFLTKFSEEDRWTVGKELGTYMSIMIITGLSNSIASFLLDKHAPLDNFLYELGRDMYHTAVIGIVL